ncbi:hypothetical protein [Ferruginibacter profundus]
MIDNHRITNPSFIDRKLILSELKAGREITIQFSYKKYNDKLLADINALCRICNENLCIRFYSHHTTGFNCKTLLKIAHVKNLHIDCMDKVQHTSALAELLHLHTLRLDIYTLHENTVLQYQNLQSITDLAITKTKSNAIDLLYLKDYTNLKTLQIDGQWKNIAAIGQLKKLNTLYLSLPEKVSLDFINHTKGLKSLYLLGGSRENINEIEQNNIEELKIEGVRRFSNFNTIAHFSKLSKLRLADESQLKNIHFTTRMSKLTDISIANCKSLHTISGLVNVPHLKNLHLYGTAIDFTNFIQQPLPATLQNLNFYTMQSKINAGIKKIILSKGYTCA